MAKVLPKGDKYKQAKVLQMQTLADKILAYYRQLKPTWQLPAGWQLLYPFVHKATWRAMEAFYHKYYDDCAPRTLLFGINPGRFGAGVTGIAFTDPIRLEQVCGIDNQFEKKPELSSIFIYEVIEQMGGPDHFFSKYFITSVCPLGFLHNGVNANYYDDSQLLETIRPHIRRHIQDQIVLFGTTSAAVSIGQGTNYKFFKKANQQHRWFEQIWPLPHPRWVMQYRHKQKAHFLTMYRECLHRAHVHNLVI